jgi:ADP-ribose pyrophosphatase YjhB (NUDIX family)
MPDLMAHFGTYQPDPGWTFYHGTPDIRSWEHGAHYGIHIGTREAAKTALEAKIGKPLDGEWDGTREYGKTLLNHDQVSHQWHPEDRTWTRHVTHVEPSYPSGGATYSDGTTKVPLDARPHIFPVRITGPMTNHPATPHGDWHANGYMQAQIKRGRAKSGYFYRNISEDEGSISAVVPSAAHLERLDEPKTASLLEHMAAWYHGTNAELEPDSHVTATPRGYERGSGHYNYYTDTENHARYHSVAKARTWGGQPHVYQVEPTGPAEPDPDDVTGLGRPWRSEHPLRVVRRLSLLEHFGAAVNPPCLHCGDPLDDEDIENESSTHEECERMRECPVHGYHDDPILAEQHRDTYTDWGMHLPFAGGIHRGFPKQLDPDVHNIVHDRARPVAERAHALVHHLAENPFHGGTQEDEPADVEERWRPHMGVHWTPSEEAARSWGTEDWDEGPIGVHGPKPSVTHVVLHAKSPDYSHIETDPDKLEARHMYGFDHDRSEHEVPLKYSAPVHLTGVSWKRGGETEWNHHDFAQPVQHVAAVGDPGFPNPYHGTERFGGRPEFSHTWFHGTKGTPEFGERKGDTDRMSQRPGEREMHSGWPQPNKLLGVHFSPLHEVAHHFVGSVSSQHGALVHARLKFSNPAHYPTEDHLNLAVAQWADKHYPHWHDDKLNANLQWQYSDSKGTRRNWHEEHLPGGKPNPHGLSDDELAERNWGEEKPSHPRYFNRVAGHAQQVLQWHPHLPEILHGFNSHMRDRGHRGITYGNNVEGPYDTDAGRGGEAATKAIMKRKDWPMSSPRHISAIAQPEDIETTHVEHVAPWRQEPQPHERTWEDVSDGDEPDEMRDRVLAYHRMHGGAYPHSGKTAARMRYRIKMTVAGGYEVPDWHRPLHDTLESAQAEMTKLRQWDPDRTAIPEAEITEAPDPKTAVLPGGDLSEMSARQEGAKVEWVRTDALLKHREWHHEPGISRSPQGQQMAPRHTVDEWAANAQSVRDEGIRQPIHLHWDHRANRAYIGEGNSRLSWAHEAGHEAVPVIGHRASGTPDGDQYQLPGPSRAAEVRERHGNHVPADISPSEFLPEHYLWHPGKTVEARIIDMASSNGDQFVTCDKGHYHWGAYGAAGLLIRHRGEDGQHRYLLQKRSPWVDHGSTWSVPGGAIGKDESPEQGAWREAREEMGSIPRHVTHHHTIKSTDCGDWAYHTVVADAKEHFMPRGGGTTQHETEGVGWHTADEIDELRHNGDLHPGFAKSWDTVRRSRGPKTTAARTYRLWRGEGPHSDEPLVPGHEGRWFTPDRTMAEEHAYDRPGRHLYHLDVTEKDREHIAKPDLVWDSVKNGFAATILADPELAARKEHHAEGCPSCDPEHDETHRHQREWLKRQGAALYSQRVERIHPRDLLPYAQREAWRMQDPAGRKHISELAEGIRQKGYQPRLHGGMSGDTHSYPPSFPITLVHDDENSWLWNGHHRTFALNEAGYDKPVPVLVKDFRGQQLKTAITYGKGRAHWKQPPEQRTGRPGEHMYRMQGSEFRDQTLAHGIEPRPSAGMLPDDPSRAVYLTATDRVYHAQPAMGRPGSPEWREAHEGFDHLKINVEGLPLTEDRTYTNPETGEKPAWMATGHVGPERIALHEPGSEHGVSYDLPGGGTEEWHPHTAVLHPDPPDYAHGMQSGGSQVEWVRREKLEPYMEFRHDRETGQSTYLPTGHTFPDRYSPARWDENEKSVAEHGMHEPVLLEYNPWTRKMHIGEGHHRLEWARRAGHTHVPVWGLKTSLEHAHAQPVPGEPKVTPEHFHGDYFPASFKPSDVLPADWVESRQPKMAVITPGSLPPEQQHAFDTEDLGVHRREMTDLARNPPPGTRVWRGEMRDETEHPADAPSAGVHWTANPDAVIANHSGEPGKRRVVWQGVVEDHEKQAFPRSHPMWRGVHRSMDWEAEVRFRPGAQVKLEGAYVDHSGSPGYLVPQKPERTSPSWEWHPLDHHVTIKHSGHGASDYSELGIPREARTAAADPAMVP